jgi:triosephosphate isomerase (TIM)
MKKIIVANWKMNPQSLLKAKKLFLSIKNGIEKTHNILKKSEIIICPPFVYLEPLSKLLQPKTYNLKPKLGAQDLFWEEKGAFTGEISPKMLKNLRIEYVILGHSERRHILKETDEMIAKKLKTAIKNKLKPILCIGETEIERRSGKTFKILKNQLNRAIENLQPETYNLKTIIIAYEPVWAIGTGNPCKPEEAKEVLIFLKKETEQLNNLTTQQLILYGGSVNSQNAKDYIEVGFDGLLIGGASLKPREFIEILKRIKNKILD